MTEKRTDGWSDIDHAARANTEFVNYLDQARANQQIRSLKLRSFDLVGAAPGRRILDLGCGNGDDAIDLARRVGSQGYVLGVDYSEAMVQECRKRCAGLDLNLEFQQGDASSLNLPSNRFDGTRSDRVFQHLGRPEIALAEIVRVTKPGGRVVISDPDYGGLLIDSDHTELVRKLSELTNKASANPWSGRRLPAMFKDAGLVEVTLYIEFTMFTYEFLAMSAKTFGLTEDTVEGSGVLTAPELRTLFAEFEHRTQTGRWLAGVPFFIVSGRKPE
jgi:ubiquinone/menaquinone biosynthesis C-methylase UbiE